MARENLYVALEDADFAQLGYKLVGMGVDGLVLEHKLTKLCMTVKAVAKSNTYDPLKDVAAHEDKLQKAEDRLVEAKRKADKREADKLAKAQAEAEAVVPENVPEVPAV